MYMKLDLKPNEEFAYFVEIIRPSGTKTYVGINLEEIWVQDVSDLNVDDGFKTDNINVEDIVDSIKRQGTMVEKYNIIKKGK